MRSAAKKNISPRGDGLWLRVLIVLLALVAGARADVVHLANGSALRGEVVSEDGETIVLKTPRSLLTIPAGDVLRIQRETPTERLRGLAEEALRRRRYERALEHLHAALKLSPEDARLRALLGEAYDGRIRQLTEEGHYAAAEAAAEEARKATLASEPLETAREQLKRRRAEFEELRAVAEGALEVGRYQQALDGYRKLLLLAPARRNELVPRLAQAHLQYGDSLFRENDYAGARTQYGEVLRLDPELLPQVQNKLIASGISIINDELKAAQGPLPKKQGLRLARQLQSILTLDPDLPHAHFLMGVVYEHLRRPRLALSEYEQVLGQAVPGSSLSDRLTLARQRSQAKVNETPLAVDTATQDEDWAYSEPGDWQVAKSEHFILHHHNPRVSARLLAAAEYHLKREAPLFGLSADTAFPVPCNIFLYRDAEAYQEATGQSAWSPAVATFTARGGMATELAIHTHQQAKLLGQTSIPHELGHLLLYRLTGYVQDVPLWIHEGVAVSQEPDFKITYLLDQVRARRQAGTAMSLDQVLTADTYPEPDDISHYYGLCYSLVQYLLSLADFEQLPRFALDARTNLDQALQKHYSITLEELRTGWQEYLEKRLASLPASPRRPE